MSIATTATGWRPTCPKRVRDVVSPNGTIGLRVPANEILLDVLRMLAGPIALTSANRHGEPEAVTADEVRNSVGESVALILDDGPCRYGQPSSVVRVHNNELQILREGVVAEGTLKRLANTMVVLVCTGNTCRSPMAEALMRQRLAKLKKCRPEELEDRGFVVRSAGLSAAAGCPASSESVEVMHELGLDLTRHEAQPLSEQLVRHADLILTMTAGHWQAIVQRWPGAADRTHMLLPEQVDVADPIGRTMDAYRHAADQIAKGVDFHAERLYRETCSASRERVGQRYRKASCDENSRRQRPSRISPQRKGDLLLKAKGHEVIDEGPATDESVDYPDFAALVASKVAPAKLTAES